MTAQARNTDGRFQAEDIVPQCEPGAKPKYLDLAIDLLQIDGRYQRRITKVGWKRIRDMAKAWRWDRCGAVLVSGPDKIGDYAVVDGQHRLEAIKLRPDLGDEVPCLVLAIPAHQDQAGVFADINKDRTGVTGINVFWARHTQGDADAVAVVGLAKRAGITISRIGSGCQKPGCTIAWRAIWNAQKTIGDDLAVRMLDILNRGQAECENALRSAAIKAMMRIYGLHAPAIDDDHMVTQLLDLDMDTVLATAKGVKAAFGGKIEDAVMKQFIQTYNRGRRGVNRLPEN